MLFGKKKVKSGLNQEEIKKIITDTIEKNTKSTNDGWTNVIAGMGGKRDKTKFTTYDGFEFLDDIQLSDAYIGDGLTKRIVDIVADDMTREWISLLGEEKDIEKVEAIMHELDAECNYNLALKWKRVFGGSVLFIGAMDGKELNEPINLNTIKSIEWLQPINRTHVFIGTSTFYDDPTQSNYGKVEVYDVQLQISPNKYEMRQIHSTRLIPFFGVPIPKKYSQITYDLKYWGASELQALWEKLRDTGGVMRNVATILYEYIISVYKFEDLQMMLSRGKEKQLLTRMDIINMTKSVINAVLLGKNEEFDRNTASVGGVSDIIDRFMIMLSAVSGIPVTRLFGRSPAGENATGESDLTNYYDMIRSKQKNELKKPLQYLINLIMISEKIKNHVTFEFNPLRQLDPKEKAELEVLKAEEAKIKSEMYMNYVNMGVLTAEEIEEKEFSDEE